MSSTTISGEDLAQKRAKELGVDILPLAESQKELNEKLFAGWTMLDEVCPISNYPLVKDPKSGLVWSIRCQMEVATDPSKRIGKDNDESNQSKKVATEPAQGKVADSSTQSMRIAEKLVEGWQLTNEICPVSRRCALLLDPKTGKKWSAALGDYISESQSSAPVGSEEDMDDPEFSNSRRRRVEMPPLDPPPKPSTNVEIPINQREQPVSSEPTISRNDVTSAIGQKLLLGWTMLGEECPVTHACPLMKDPKTGRKWSAALNKFVEEVGSSETPNLKPEIANVTPEKTALPLTERGEKEAMSSSESTRQKKVLDPIENTSKSIGKHIIDFDLQSKRIGDRLLRGWTMLEEVCPVTKACPLMLDRKSGRKYSAALDRYVDELKKEATTAVQPTSSKTIEPAKQTSTTNISKDIGEHPVDPQGSHPAFTRSHENHDLGAYFDHPSEPEESTGEFLLGSWKDKKQNPNNPKQTPPTRSKPRISFAPSVRQPLSRVNEEEDEDAGDNLSTRSVLSGVSYNGDTQEELNRAEATIRSKMRECRAALSNLEISIDSDSSSILQCERLVHLIGVCGSALNRLRDPSNP